VTARDKFNGIAAEFWDCSDAERLTHLDPISALEAIVESHLEPGRPTDEVIREMGAITCEGFRRATITEEHIEEATDRAIDRAREALDDDSGLGDPDGDRAMFTVEVLAKRRPAFEAAVRALVAEAVVRLVEVTNSVLLSPDETIEILRVERPEWFEASPPAAPPEGA